MHSQATENENAPSVPVDDKTVLKSASSLNLCLITKGRRRRADPPRHSNANGPAMESNHICTLLTYKHSLGDGSNPDSPLVQLWAWDGSRVLSSHLHSTSGLTGRLQQAVALTKLGQDSVPNLPSCLLVCRLRTVLFHQDQLSLSACRHLWSVLTLEMCVSLTQSVLSFVLTLFLNLGDWDKWEVVSSLVLLTYNVDFDIRNDIFAFRNT